MTQFVINKCNVEITKESLTSVISSKLNACGREVQKYTVVQQTGRWTLFVKKLPSI